MASTRTLGMPSRSPSSVTVGVSAKTSVVASAATTSSLSLAPIRLTCSLRVARARSRSSNPFFSTSRPMDVMAGTSPTAPRGTGAKRPSSTPWWMTITGGRPAAGTVERM